MKITLGFVIMALVFYVIGAKYPGLATRFLPGGA